MDVTTWRSQFLKASLPVIFPVIHVISTDQVRSNIDRIQHKPIGGVFLINHSFQYIKFISIIKQLRSEFPQLWIGVNFLGQSGDIAFPILADLEKGGCRIDGYWADDGCIDERTPFFQTKAHHISDVRRSSSWKGLYLGGVAFKKQREVSPIHYKLSAEIATGFMDIVCTSGTKTGSAPDVEKIKQFREGCGREKVLAVASGITPDNITEFIPYLDCVLVATGISTDFHNINPVLLDRLLDTTREARSQVSLSRPKGWYLSLIAENTKGPTKAWLDPSSIYADADAFHDLIEDMVSPFPVESYDVVAGIDGMGVPTGGAIAQKHQKGFVNIRQTGKLCVGTTDIEFTDYSNSEKGLEIPANCPFKPGSRVLIVDQCVETGATMAAAIKLVMDRGGVVAGVTAICIERNSPQVDKLKTAHKCHDVVPEFIHHLFDQQIFKAEAHSRMLL